MLRPFPTAGSSSACAGILERLLTMLEDANSCALGPAMEGHRKPRGLNRPSTDEAEGDPAQCVSKHSKFIQLTVQAATILMYLLPSTLARHSPPAGSVASIIVSDGGLVTLSSPGSPVLPASCVLRYLHAQEQA